MTSQESAGGMEDDENNYLTASQFGVTDYAVFCLMVVVSMSVGIWSAVRARKNPTVQDFLMGGKKMPALPVALSLLGGVISALSILGNATEIYLYGTQLCINLLGAVFAVFFIQSCILPIFINLNLVTVVEYLELRYESRLLRRLSSVCQLIPMFFYLGICLYAPSLALSSVTPFPTWASVVFLGFVCTFYVAIGGVRAVVYTDVLQTLLMFGGVLAVVIKVCLDLGGLKNVWDIAYEGGRIEFFNMDPNPYIRHTFWSTMVLGMHFIVSVVALSQAQYQRFASVQNVQHCKWLLKFFLLGLIVLWGLFYLSGLVAYAVYKDCDPLTSGRIEQPDQIIPYLVMDKMAQFPGLPGLFVAAVYGGVLSSMSSHANSIACLIWEDLLKHMPFFANMSDTAATTTVKIITGLAGVTSVGLAMLVGKLGTLFSVAYSISGAIMGPMDGLFIAGIFIPWANKTGAVAGLITSFVINLWRVIGKFIRGGQSPPYLPLSTQECPENYYNSTTTTTTTTTIPILDESVSYEFSSSFYDISYCYNGAIGILITVIVTALVSLITRPKRSGEVNPQLLNATSQKMYESACAYLGWNKEEGPENKDNPIKLTSITSVNTQATLLEVDAIDKTVHRKMYNIDDGSSNSGDSGIVNSSPSASRQPTP